MIVTSTGGGYTTMPAPSSQGGWFGQLLSNLPVIGQTVVQTYQGLNQPKGANTAPYAGVPASTGSGVSMQTVLLVVGLVAIGGGVLWAVSK